MEYSEEPTILDFLLKEKDRVDRMIQICDHNILSSRKKKKEFLHQLSTLLKKKERVKKEKHMQTVCKSAVTEKERNEEGIQLCKKQPKNGLLVSSFKKIEKIKKKTKNYHGLLWRKFKNQRKEHIRIYLYNKKKRMITKKTNRDKHIKSGNQFYLNNENNNLPLCYGVLSTNKVKEKNQFSQLKYGSSFDAPTCMALSIPEEIEKKETKRKKRNNDESFVIKEMEGMLESFINVCTTFFSFGITKFNNNMNFLKGRTELISKRNEEARQEHQKKRKRKKKKMKKEFSIRQKAKCNKPNEESTLVNKKESIQIEQEYFYDEGIKDFQLEKSLEESQNETQQKEIIPCKWNNQLEIKKIQSRNEEIGSKEKEKTKTRDDEEEVEEEIQKKLEKTKNKTYQETKKKEINKENNVEEHCESEVDILIEEETINNEKIKKEETDKIEIKIEKFSMSSQEEEVEYSKSTLITHVDTIKKNEHDIKENNNDKIMIQDRKILERDSSVIQNNVQVEKEQIRKEKSEKEKEKRKTEKSEKKLEKTKEKKKKEKKKKRKKDSTLEEALQNPTTNTIKEPIIEDEPVIKKDLHIDPEEPKEKRNLMEGKEETYEDTNIKKERNKEIQKEVVNLAIDSNRRETNLNARKIIDLIKNIEVDEPNLFSSVIRPNDNIYEEENQNKDMEKCWKESSIHIKDKEKEKKRKKEKEEGTTDQIKEKKKKKNTSKKKSKDKKKEEGKKEKTTVDDSYVEHKKESDYLLTVSDDKDIIKETIFDNELLEYKTSDNDMVKDIMNEYSRTPQLTSLYETLYQKKDKDFHYILK